VTEFLAAYGLFLAKAVTWVVALLAIFGGIASLIRQARGGRVTSA
jgi:hypothetical protein